MSTGYRVLLAAGVICAGGAAGFLAYHLHQSQPTLTLSPIEKPSAQNSGQLSQQSDEDSPPAAHPAIPENVPDLSLVDIGGVRHKLSQWKGRPLLINFWATWCDPCRREIPLLKTLRHERAADGVEIVGIAVDFRDAVARYAQRMGIDYPVLVGEQDGLEAIAAFGMDTVFPFTVFADSQGRIVTLKVGELHSDEAGFILDRVRDVDHGRLALPAARKQIADTLAALAAARARSAPGQASSGPQASGSSPIETRNTPIPAN